MDTNEVSPELLARVVENIDETQWRNMNDDDKLAMLQVYSPIAVRKGVTVEDIDSAFAGTFDKSDIDPANASVKQESAFSLKEQLLSYMREGNPITYLDSGRSRLVAHAKGVTFVAKLTQTSDYVYQIAAITVAEDEDKLLYNEKLQYQTKSQVSVDTIKWSEDTTAAEVEAEDEAYDQDEADADDLVV